ncbi:MAG: NAD(P)-binding protein [Candidatus Eremiobacteraeota bacterium]|nr:NAD(P)-binding protein [Candidatus Eremiobacteraeota bacterium]
MLSEIGVPQQNDEPRTVDVAILGSGPCGLGAAWRLSQEPSESRPAFVIVDRNASPGGSASSFTTPEGFVFDYGGHVLYPHEHYSGFAALLDELVPEWFESKPVRGVWMDGRLIPYPLQRNLHRLQPGKLLVAMLGLLRVRLREVTRRKQSPGPNDLERYLQNQFGRGLTRIALAPLNRKMWAYEPSELGSGWTSQRSGSSAPNVSGARVRETVRSIFTRRDNLGWSESTRVRYPALGGSGSIWTALADRVRDHRIDGEQIVGIDERKKLIRLASGARIRYERLLSTLPLDVLIGLLEDNGDVAALGKQLRYAQAGFIGFGFSGEPPPVLRGVHSFTSRNKTCPAGASRCPPTSHRATSPPANTGRCSARSARAPR